MGARRTTGDCQHDLWIVIPWHPSLHRSGLGSALYIFIEDPVFAMAWREAFGAHAVHPRLRLSWRLSKQQLASKIASQSAQRLLDFRFAPESMIVFGWLVGEGGRSDHGMAFDRRPHRSA